jgi:deoxyadenosine/deoxycytidine kinase
MGLMRETRFIFVEGIMGSGKSTTASFLTEQLQRNEIAARFVEEGPTVEEPEHPLRVATAYSHPNAIWLDLTVEEFVATSLRRWHNFVEAVLQDSEVTICNGLLFHGNMTDLLLMNADVSVLHHYVAQIIESLQSFKPVVIYFSHPDVAQAIHRICNERGRKWEAYQVSWKVSSPYGVQRSLHGFDGLVQLYQVYCMICEEIFSSLQLPKLAICNMGDWETYYRRIHTFLQLPLVPPTG